MLKLISTLVLLFIFLPLMNAEAQQRRASDYERLLQRTDQPSSFIDHIIIPKDETTSTVTVFFRLDYDFLPFVRIRPNMTPPRTEAEYFSTLQMGLEIFEGAAPTSRRGSSGNSIFRDSYRDTIWVDTFEQTKSRSDFAQGFISADLTEGEYHYLLQLIRTESVREQSSSRRNISIKNYENSDAANIILLRDFTLDDQELHATLLNYTNNVLYGQDYSVMMMIPADPELADKELTLEVRRLPAGDDSGTGEIRHSVKLDEGHLIRIGNTSVQKSDGEIEIQSSLKQEESGFLYALVEVPNQDFENARYRLRLLAEGLEKPVVERLINSQWLDMPVSLYNLDVAISMLRFIVSENELRRLRSGSTSERERKFREFWAERDPTPETEFNELMAEFYRRIDYAYQNFTSLQTPGYETDQGRAYIVYGPPLNVERRLPTNAPTREIWEYPNRTLIFEATTGFGDFRLVSES